MRKCLIYCNKSHNLLTTWDRFSFHRLHGAHFLELLKLHHFLWGKDKWCWWLTLAATWWRGWQPWGGREHWNAQLCTTFHTPVNWKNNIYNHTLSMSGNLISNALFNNALSNADVILWEIVRWYELFLYLTSNYWWEGSWLQMLMFISLCNYVLSNA